MNTFRLLRNNLPRNAGDPLVLVKKLMNTRACSFQIISVPPDENTKIMNKLKNSQSSGIDNINTYVI